MSYQTILCELSDSVLRVTLNRPDKLNALTDLMLQELHAAFAQAAGDKATRCVLLTGAGKGFCPGQDLANVQEMSRGGRPAYGEHIRSNYNPLILAMTRLPKPIVAAINGVAAGAGMSLAIACDVRVASEKASFLQAFVNIGLVPDSGSTWLLPRLIGRQRALELMLSGRKLSAAEALEWGLVNQVVAPEQLMEEAIKVAARYAAAPTYAIGQIKRNVDFAESHSLEETLALEAKSQAECGLSADHQEGIQAFLEKRTPAYKGE
ncbi:MAG TPA: enoyl-CoA hydratase-related protein [Planctomycetaceae bacterium]|jgi:2-(1,2-epoxy-1,2-dihydrophenyl)acetyl-CoA isomerase|nr:enoyl-CoA hydratase-related protein [Planctomycetaceae bacterium]